MKHFQRLQMDAAARAQCFKLVEKMLTGELVAKHPQLQGLGFPRGADRVGRTQDDFIDGSAKRILGRFHIFVVEQQFLGAAIDVAQEARDVIDKGCLLVRAAAIFQQEQGIQAVVHDVDQAVRSASAAIGAGLARFARAALGGRSHVDVQSMEGIRVL